MYRKLTKIERTNFLNAAETLLKKGKVCTNIECRTHFDNPTMQNLISVPKKYDYLTFEITVQGEIINTKKGRK